MTEKKRDQQNCRNFPLVNHSYNNDSILLPKMTIILKVRGIPQILQKGEEYIIGI